MQAAAESFLGVVGRAAVGDANAAVCTLAGYLLLDDLRRAAFLALVGGALVERGCAPSPMVGPLIKRLQGLLELSAALADACLAQLPKAQGDDHDPVEVFESTREQVARSMPLEGTAWSALKDYWRPAIAVFSVSPSARAAACGLRDLAAKIADHHEGGYWLRLMLSVLDQEPIVAVEPRTGTGILGRISGIVDNFQLHVLLMDGFPRSGFFSRRRVAKRVADVARGIGPQQTNDFVTGAWNLYTWRAIQPGLKLPDQSDYGANDCWIWNEGTPEEIPVFDGRRAILLGPPSYPRSWGCQRMFDKLPARLDCERQLSKHEVTDWLQRMLNAKGAR